jgi:phospholipase A1
VPWLGSNVSVMARKWWRRPEHIDDDDNPDIKNYYGRGDVVVRWERGRHQFSVLLRHNLRLDPGRGFAQLDWSWAVPWFESRLHVQATSGYGESLIDYNHRQNTLGLGLSFGKW